MSLPFVDPDADLSEETGGRVRELIPWLPDPHQCQECGELCEAGQTFDRVQCLVVDAWVCPNEECGGEYYRERY